MMLIDELELMLRTQNSLRNAGVKTIGDIANIHVEGIGKAGWEEMAIVFAWRLHMSLIELSACKEKAARYDQIVAALSPN